MGSITRVIGLASAVICSCAIATTANAAPETVKELVEKVYLPYTKYENPYQSIDKYQKEVRKLGCRIEEGKVGWEIRHQRTNYPCYDDGNVSYVGIEGEGKKSSLTLIGASSTVHYYKKELASFEKLGQWRNQGNRLSIYKNAGVYYELQEGTQYFYLIVSQEKPTVLAASNSKSTPQNIDTKSSVEPSHVENYDGSSGSLFGWFEYLAGALILAFMGFSYYRNRQNRQRIAQKIQNHEIWQGATKRQVLASWGKPDAIDKRPGPRVTWEGWYYGGQTENTAKRVVWFRKSSNKGEEGAQKWNIRR